MSDARAEVAKKCWISYVNGHDLLSNNNNESRQRELLVQGFGRKHPFTIPLAVFGLCFKFYHDRHLDSVKINTLDMGLKKILRYSLVYKDTMYQQLLKEWSMETGIPTKHMLVYNYTERKNKTMRPNAHLEVDLKEEFEGDGQWTDDQIKRHLIPTKYRILRIKSIHDRIGELHRYKRSFMLLDDRRTKTLVGSEGGDKSVLVALKYFDILEQKLYFVDWLRLEKVTAITFGEIAKYIESELIPNTMASSGGCLHSLYELNAKISEFEKKSGNSGQCKFKMFEEEAVYFTWTNPNGTIVKVNALNISDTLNDDYYNGDIFVLQINPRHPYFSPFFGCDVKDLLPVARKVQDYKQESKAKGLFWYSAADDFIQSLVDMTNTVISIRENTGWENRWSKALSRHDPQSATESGRYIEDSTKMGNIMWPKHKWTVDGKTTFGMIRERLGSYYSIKPGNIEIWLPQMSEEVHKWNYDSGGRGAWNQSISDLTKQHALWKLLCPLKFEFVAYNVRDFDQMTGCNNAVCQDSGARDLALFSISIHTPSFPAIEAQPIKMDIIHQKQWIAKDFIQSILDLMIENPIFASSFFSQITEYVRRRSLWGYCECI